MKKHIGAELFLLLFSGIYLVACTGYADVKLKQTTLSKHVNPKEPHEHAPEEPYWVPTENGYPIEVTHDFGRDPVMQLWCFATISSESNNGIQFVWIMDGIQQSMEPVRYDADAKRRMTPSEKKLKIKECLVEGCYEEGFSLNAVAYIYDCLFPSPSYRTMASKRFDKSCIGRKGQVLIQTWRKGKIVTLAEYTFIVKAVD